MTCVIALAKDDHIYMGADGVVSTVNYVWPIKQPKVCINQDFIFGSAGSPRAVALLRYRFNIPNRRKDQSLDEYISLDFTRTLKECFEMDKWADWQKGDSDEDSDGDLPGLGNTAILMGHKGRLYLIDPSCNILELGTNFCALGSGQDIATGAMEALLRNYNDPDYMIKEALGIVSHHWHNIRPPYTVLKINSPYSE